MKQRHHIHSHPAMPGINPILAAAASLARLRGITDEPLSQEQAERDLDQQVMSVGLDDLSALEGMLAVQAHVLHAIFTQAAERCAEGGSDEKVKLYSAIALKSQSYCRQTIAALAKIKKSSDYNRSLFPDFPKSRNELKRDFSAYPPVSTYPLFKDSAHAPLDTGRTKPPVGADEGAATLEKGRGQNRGG